MDYTHFCDNSNVRRQSNGTYWCRNCLASFDYEPSNTGIHTRDMSSRGQPPGDAVDQLIEANAAIGPQIKRLIRERDEARADLKAYDEREVERCAAFAKSNAALMLEREKLRAENESLKAEMARLVLATETA